ncbi:MAG: hypothetical protein CM1200mP10_15030 [Candidatus Neomarinimicrobiota bacterium]|nr:MAG: hypothetical protein CM1200mP10_15030 [Candidatus Neomarinimicrobiota bacterium]
MRDNQAEFLQLLSMISSTLDKVGHEVYSLQRPEISEVNELFLKGTVGSFHNATQTKP